MMSDVLLNLLQQIITLLLLIAELLCRQGGV